MNINDPDILTRELTPAVLNGLPRPSLLKLFKHVDAQMDMIQASGTVEQHNAWMKPWTILIDHIDPGKVIEFPLSDWKQIEQMLGQDKPGQQNLFA